MAMFRPETEAQDPGERAELQRRRLRDLLERLCRVDSPYAGVAMECREGKGSLHVFDDVFLPEIVDPVTGEPAEEGELVLTTLTKEALPLLRYRTADVADPGELPRQETGKAKRVFERSAEADPVPAS